MRFNRLRAERIARLLDKQEREKREADATLAAAEALRPASGPRREFRAALRTRMLQEFDDASRTPSGETLTSAAAGLPSSAAQAVAVRHDVLVLTEPAQLAALAHELGIEPDQMEAAIETAGSPVRVTYTEHDEEHEILIGAYDELDDEQRRWVIAFVRSLRNNRA